ncbi:MAG: hypothetical protein M9922_07170 [Microthrixaceae bacterium]|nr:hypothetical protein [Microthrixaceae bacterium]
MTVDLDCNELPEVTLSLAARESAASLDTDLAAEVGCDVAQDLVVESLALREGDPVQLEHALTNERLSRTRARIGSNATAGITEDWIYDFDSMELVLLRDPVRPQAVAELGLHSTGTITAVTHGDPTVDTVTQTDSWVFDVVHRLARSDDRFLIRQELSPLDPMVLDG